jgi:hypothetical protein
MSKLRVLFAALAAVLSLAGLAAPAEAAKIYVDNQLGWVKAEDKVQVASPQPVQLVIDFQTDGVSNAKAIKEVKPIITKYLQQTALFSTLSETPVASGALLTVRFNNIADKNAAGKGFKAGLTFGLAATQVADNYDVDFALVPASGQEPLRTQLKHAIILTIGKKADPSLGTEYKKAKEAVDVMVGQSVEQGAHALARQDGFPGK